FVNLSDVRLSRHVLQACSVYDYRVTTVTSTLPLHDALPIYALLKDTRCTFTVSGAHVTIGVLSSRYSFSKPVDTSWAWTVTGSRSEEHTSELQSRFDLVCRLLLEKKKTKREKSETA